MVNIIENILSEQEMNFFENIIYDENFSIDERRSIKIGDYNFFDRKSLNLSDELKNKIVGTLKEKFNLDVHIVDSWINHVSKNSNVDDIFHNDIGDMSLVTYLNENFSGGELEYIEEDTENIIKVTPKKNMALLMRNKVLHRVLNVTEGNRFSIIIFFNTIKKKNFTLL